MFRWKHATKHKTMAKVRCFELIEYLGGKFDGNRTDVIQ